MTTLPPLPPDIETAFTKRSLAQKLTLLAQLVEQCKSDPTNEERKTFVFLLVQHLLEIVSNSSIPLPPDLFTSIPNTGLRCILTGFIAASLDVAFTEEGK